MRLLGERIAELRNQRGWTQAQLAKKLSVSSKTIKNWENDVSDPSATYIVGIAHLFAVSSDLILGLTNAPSIKLDSLPLSDQRKLRAMFQAYITTSLQFPSDE